MRHLSVLVYSVSVTAKRFLLRRLAGEGAGYIVCEYELNRMNGSKVIGKYVNLRRGEYG